MIIVLVAAVLGALIGGTIAARRGGRKMDILQYSVIYLIAFAILGLFVLIFISRVFY